MLFSLRVQVLMNQLPLLMPGHTQVQLMYLEQPVAEVSLNQITWSLIWMVIMSLIRHP